jgi:hypothetical protein
MALSPKIKPDEFRHVTQESQLGFACSHFGCLFQVGIDPESENLHFMKVCVNKGFGKSHHH